ncbi:MAG: hypothetical protein AAFR88_07030 [Pseudomonadota bacterium]
MPGSKPDRAGKTAALDQSDEIAAGGALSASPSLSTNLMIADIALRGASSLFRRNVEGRIARAGSRNEDEARDALDGRTVLTSIALYGASKMATRSPIGLGLVVGGLAFKVLYDRGKARQRDALKRAKESADNP